MPPDFNEACYGGNFNQNLAGTKPIYSSELFLDQDSEALRVMLGQLALKHKMKLFDEGARYKNAFFLVYLCSDKGIFAFIDSRGATPNSAHIRVFSYRDPRRLEPFIADLSSALQSHWPASLKKDDPSKTMLKSSLF